MSDECDLHMLIGCAVCFPADPSPPVMRFHDKPARTTGGLRSSWTPHEISLAEDLALSDSDVATLTGRTARAVHFYRLRVGLVEKQSDREVDYSASRAMARWTKAELAFVEETMGEPAEDIAAKLGRTRRAVVQQRHRLAARGSVSDPAAEELLERLIAEHDVKVLNDDGEIVLAHEDGLLEQLRAAIVSGDVRSGAAGNKARLPLNEGALDLLEAITREARIMWAEASG